MAQAQALKVAPAPEAAAAPPKKGSKGLIIIIAAAVVVVAGAVGGTWYFMKGQASASATAAAPEKKPEAPPQYVNIDQIVVNLNDAGQDHYLQTSMVLSVKDSDTADAIKLYMPMIRNRILLLLSSKHTGELTAPEAKLKLAADVLKETRDSLPANKENSPDKGVQNVLFNSFVIQ